MIVAGIPLSFLTPFVLATMFWLAIFLWSPAWHVAWFVLFAVLCAITIPLLYLQESRVGNSYYAGVMDQTNVYGSPGTVIATPGTAGGTVAGAIIAANPRAVAAGWVEVFLTGPRLVLNARTRLRLQRYVSACDLRRPAELLGLLASLEGGIETEKACKPGEPRDEMMPAVAYLIFYRWITMRTDGARLWITSAGRDALHSESSRA